MRGAAPPGIRVPAVDVRDELLRRVAPGLVTACIVTDEAGVIAGGARAREEAERLGLSVARIVADGARVASGEEVARVEGSPRQIVMAEEVLIGLLAKPSGIATRAARFVAKAGGRPRVVSGAWRKMPPVMKEMIRDAVRAGGADSRILPGPFVYLDKTYVALLGGIRESLAAVAHLEAHAKVVQVKGRQGDLASEAREAAEHGADIIFIDTGVAADIPAVAECLIRVGTRGRVKLAFGGGVDVADVDALKALDIDILDIGRQIVDAPLLDMRLEIVGSGRMP